MNFFLSFVDIDECQIPELKSRCVQNAECCNLPAHFICKCLPGYDGDGEVECKGKRKREYSLCNIHAN